MGSLLAIAWLSTGVFVVAPDEQAVVRRFGAVATRFGPGIHYRIPWPVDAVDVLKTTSVMKLGVGYALSENQAPHGTELLSGDTNLLNIALLLQYVIADPADYLLETEAPERLMSALAESVLTETVTSMPVDEVLTTGRLPIQERVKVETQKLLDHYESGIQITSASIMAIVLDKSVADAFQNVTNAMAQREKKINEARAYSNNLLPKARGEAHTLVTQAGNYKEQRVAEAVGDTDRFLAMLDEYRRAPEVTRVRLYLQAMEKILPRVNMYVIDSENGKVPLNLRIGNP